MRCAAAGPVAEQVLLLENISTSIKIGPDQLPSVYKLLVEAVRWVCARGEASLRSKAYMCEEDGITLTQVVTDTDAKQ